MPCPPLTACGAALALAITMASPFTALAAPRYPEGVSPTHNLLLATTTGPGMADTGHTLGDLLCPLLMDDWRLSVQLGTLLKPRARNLVYVFVRNPGERLDFHVLRVTNPREGGMEIVLNVSINDRSFKEEKAAPILQEIFNNKPASC